MRRCHRRPQPPVKSQLHSSAASRRRPISSARPSTDRGARKSEGEGERPEAEKGRRHGRMEPGMEQRRNNTYLHSGTGTPNNVKYTVTYLHSPGWNRESETRESTFVKCLVRLMSCESRARAPRTVGQVGNVGIPGMWSILIYGYMEKYMSMGNGCKPRRVL